MERVPQVIKELLHRLGAKNPGVSKEEAAGQIVFQITAEDTRPIIGPRGETLRALEFIVRKMMEKDIPEAQFVIDAGGYRLKQIKDLEQKALMMAERARSFQYDVELTPMSAYERLIVHAVLTNAPNVKTESRGEGRERRVVIKYAAN